MGTAKRGSPVAAPFHTPLPDAGQEGTLLRAPAETPALWVTWSAGRGQETRLHCGWKCPDRSSLPTATAAPFSAPLRFKPKAAFLYLKKKKKVENQTQHLTSCNTWSFSLLFLPFHLSLHVSFPYWLFCLLLFSLPIRDKLGVAKGLAKEQILRIGAPTLPYPLGGRKTLKIFLFFFSRVLWSLPENQVVRKGPCGLTFPPGQ